MYEFEYWDSKRLSDPLSFTLVDKLSHIVCDLQSVSIPANIFNATEYLNQGLVQQKGNNYTVLLEEQFLYSLYTVLADRGKARYPQTCEELISFLEWIDGNFDNSTECSILTDRLFHVAVAHYHVLNTPEYFAYLSTKTHYTLSYYDYKLIAVIHNSLSFHRLPTSNIAALLRLFQKLLSPEPGTFGVNLAELNVAIKSFGMKYPSLAKDVVAELFSNWDLEAQEISTFLWAGILITEPAYASLLVKEADNPIYHITLIVTFANIKLEKVHLPEIKALIHRLDLSKKPVRLNIGRLYYSMINAFGAMDSAIKQTLIEDLRNLLADNDEDIVAVTLNFMETLEDQDILYELLKAFVSIDAYQSRFNNTLDRMLQRFIDVSRVFPVVIAMGPAKAMEFNFRNVSSFVRKKNKVVFDTDLIKYLIDDIGAVRIIAQRILDALTDSTPDRHFQVNILALSPKDQFKLYTSILANFREPEYMLPFVLPLVFSPNFFVREVLLTRIELLVEDYGDLVLNVLKTEWPSMTTEQEAVYQRIHLHKETYFSQLKRRCEIKELNPFYTQGEILRQFMNTMNKHMSRSITESVERNSIISQIATTVEVNKGGGWRLSKDRETSKFSKLSHPGLVFPRSYFLDREAYEWQLRQTKFENWSNILSKWEGML